MKLYCLDTGFFIQCWNLHYTPEISSSFWEVVAKMSIDGEIFAPIEVKEELKKQDDQLFSWAAQQPDLFWKIGDDDRIETAFIRVINDEEGKRLIQHEKTSSPADPWLVAWCMVNDAILVTTEGKTTAFNKSNTKKRRLPDICEKFEVECLNPSQFLHHAKFRFETSRESK